MVVVVIDISKMNIDANVVRGSEPAVRQVLETLLDMTNGCICCIQRDDLLKEVRALAEARRFDALAIESSGISEPPLVAATSSFEDEEGFRLSDVARRDSRRGALPQPWQNSRVTSGETFAIDDIIYY